MRIWIRTQETRLHLLLPDGMLFNHLNVWLAVKVLEGKGIRLSRQQIMKLVDCLKAYRKSHTEWTLVQVNSADGDEVLVKF